MLTWCASVQLIGSAVDGADGDLPVYNNIWAFFFTECFTKTCIDMEHLVNRALWRTSKGAQGKSPAQCVLSHPDFPATKTESGGLSLCTPQLMTYFDFLVANAPWYNAVEGEGLTSCAALDDEHEAGLQDVHDLLKPLFFNKAGALKEPQRRRLVLDSDDE